MATDRHSWPARIDEIYLAWSTGDAETFKSAFHEDAEIVPLIAGLADPGPWCGHEAIDRLLEITAEHWQHFTVVPVDVRIDGDRLLIRSHVSVRTTGEAQIAVDGEVLHVIELRDGRIARIEERRAAGIATV